MTGKDYFSYENQNHGYILEVIKVLEGATGLDFDLKLYSSWDIVFRNFLNCEVDILFGANRTEAREEKMIFNEALEEISYAAFSDL